MMVTQTWQVIVCCSWNPKLLSDFSGVQVIAEASESPADGIVRSFPRAIEPEDLARVQRENSYTMHGALSPEIGEPEASSGESDASTGSRSVTETERRIVTGPPTIRQHSATSTRRPYSD